MEIINDSYLYFLILFGSILIPFIKSFDPRVSYIKSFGPLFLGIGIIGAIFIIWDMVFTHLGFWGFNPRYLSGIYIGNLPIEEVLFFVIIPFCSIFIYRVLNFYIPKDILAPYSMHISNYFIGFSAAIAIVFYDRWYTVLTFGLLCLLIIWQSKIRRSPWLGRFYLAYLVIFIPFFMVNGLLTGSLIEGEIVWYNPDEMMDIRIGTIPLEDFFYGMSLILGIISIYEYLGAKWNLGYSYDRTTE